MFPVLQLESYVAFLTAYRLFRLSRPDALERSTALDPDDPFIMIPLGLTECPTVLLHLLSELRDSEQHARRLALLLDLDAPEIRDWARVPQTGPQ